MLRLAAWGGNLDHHLIYHSGSFKHRLSVSEDVLFREPRLADLVTLVPSIDQDPVFVFIKIKGDMPSVNSGKDYDTTHVGFVNLSSPFEIVSCPPCSSTRCAPSYEHPTDESSTPG